MDSDQFDSFVEDVIGEKMERPLIIIAAAKIDDLLLRMLSKYLYPGSSKTKDDLLDGDQPISSFSARIKLCCRLGLIDEKLFNILDRIRKIRNMGAHRIIFDIKHSPVREHTYELQRGLKNRSSYRLTKSRYFNENFTSSTEELQCMLVTICVILQAICEIMVTTSGNQNALLISQK